MAAPTPSSHSTQTTQTETQFHQENEARKKTLYQAALEYHESSPPGKLAVVPTKFLTNQRDLSLAYSPGVAAPCELIAKDPSLVSKYTARGNLIAVITNGTAVLGLGNIGPLAAKPVMEGKAVLFKKFAGIDVFDIEVNEPDPKKLIEIIAALEPTFGGINLEDIKAPDCFQVERELRDRLSIPVFHDDQHGTAIVVAAAITNALKLVDKKIGEVQLVCSGAGAAALACLDLLLHIGLNIENVRVFDLGGMVTTARMAELDPERARFARNESLTLEQALKGADVFLGLSAGGVLKPEMTLGMNSNPIVMALANPYPEIMPEDLFSARSDAICSTGRSDYPNQVNNALCFPYIFRGALDVGATTITREMEAAAIEAIAELVHHQPMDSFGSDRSQTFSRTYLIPKPFDPRLITTIAPAVAKAAMDSGVATKPITDWDEYLNQLQQFVYHSGTLMRPFFAKAKRIAPANKRIVFAEGEDERVLRAIQIIVEEKLAHPILIGRSSIIMKRIEKLGLEIEPDVDFEIANTDFDERYKDYVSTYFEMTGRDGVTLDYAKIEMRRRHTLIGAMMIYKGDADGMVCGTFGTPDLHLHYVDQVLGHQDQTHVYAAMNGLVLPGRQIFLADTHINYDPSAEQIAEITIMAADELTRMGIVPKIALVSHSNFGSSHHPSAVKMRHAYQKVKALRPDLDVDGEMHGDCALDETLRMSVLPNSVLKGSANLLILPNIDAANISYNLLKTASGNNVAIGPILLGVKKPVAILTASSTIRRIVNMTALTVIKAYAQHEEKSRTVK